jgi:hypothetical protein
MPHPPLATDPATSTPRQDSEHLDLPSDHQASGDSTGDIEALRIALARSNAALSDAAGDLVHDALALLVETVERIHPTMRSREQRLCRLIEYYQPDRQIEHAADGYAGEAFALVSRESRPGVDGTMITTHATFEAACAYAGDDVLNGWAPVALFGLDTGEMVLLVVTSPVVHLSPHRQTMQNPLEDCS